MRHSSVFWMLTIFLGFVLQVSFADLISVRGILPNLLLLGTIFFGLRGGPVVGEWVGFVWGLLSDVASISVFGSQTFMFTLIGYSVGRLQGKVDEEKPTAQMAIVLIMSLLYLSGLVFFESLFQGSTQRYKARASFFQPVYSSVIAPLIFWLLWRWDKIFNRGPVR